MYIWGDVAYRNGMFFSPQRWRELLKPHVKALIDLCHARGLPVVYHGCGNARPIFRDFVEMGLDGYNPLEAKADLDVVELSTRFAGKLAFVGNIDVRVLERGDPAEIEREVRYKLQAATGGGWIFQSDHSISSAVAPESYELALQTLRKYGDYPLPA
jgi:uroporphyrinogen-III decarboxylase